MDYKSTSVDVLYEELKKGVVSFDYTKKDGTIRTAKGTLHEKILNEKLGGKSSTKTSSPKVQVFWDLEKDAFRSFTIGTEKNLISFQEGV